MGLGLGGPAGWIGNDVARPSLKSKDSALPIKRAIIGDPDIHAEDADMQFRLTYEGRLASAGGHLSKHKHEIRKVFHRQLKSFWDFNPFFKIDKPWVYSPPRGDFEKFPDSRKEQLGGLFNRCGYKFVPIVSDDLCVFCSLDILFLRPDPPGELLLSGDIDNRIKTLIDALRMPANTSELGGYDTPDEDEALFFVLLEDDRLVTKLSVETDMLLQPTVPEAGKQDCRLVITVGLTPYHAIHGNVGV